MLTRLSALLVQPTSKLPFLNCMTLVLLMQVPSGKMRIGSFSGSITCSRSLRATSSRSPASDLCTKHLDNRPQLELYLEPDVCGTAGERALDEPHEAGVGLAHQGVGPVN